MTKRRDDAGRDHARGRTDRVGASAPSRARAAHPSSYDDAQVLARIRNERTYPIAAAHSENHAASRVVLAQADEYRRAAQASAAAGLVNPAVSSLHEAARLAITSLATHDGYRFRDAPGAHEAVIDYGNARGVVTDAQHAVLHQLSDARNTAMYPADMIEVSSAELLAYAEAVDLVMARCKRAITPRVPPPPKR